MATQRPVGRLLKGTFSILSTVSPSQYICQPCLRRSLHRSTNLPPVPKPTPFVPDVNTFLTLIGRGLSTHASKFTTWESLFKLTSPQLKELGIEPTRSRRYLLRWREKFRRGEYGIGGDLKHVSPEGVAELRVVEIPSLPSRQTPQVEVKDVPSDSIVSEASINHTPGITKLIVNVPPGAETYQLSAGQTTADLKKPNFIKLKDGHLIVGSYVVPSKGGKGRSAVLKVTDGMWEDKRGRKIHGGERRRAETLHKMRVAERKKNER